MRGTILALAAVVLLVEGCARKESAVKLPGQPSGPHPTVEWILACRVGQGGVGCFPGDSAFTTRTGMALEALADLGGLQDLGGKDSLISWLRSRQADDGGFIEADDYYLGKKLRWGTISALEPTYWAVHALKLLGASPSRPGDAARFVAARQSPNGAFDGYEYAWGATSEALYATFWAVAALKDLGLPVPDSAKVVRWVQQMQNTNDLRGGFMLSLDNFNYSSVPGTYYGVRTLALLMARPLDGPAVKKFLLSSYGQEPDGGFEVGHGDNWNNYDHYSRMQDTYAALTALALLGLPLTDSDTSRASRPASDCAAWIASCQRPDGGFARFGVTDQTPLPSPGEMMATWQAVRALSILRQPVPRPAQARKPLPEVVPHTPAWFHPLVDHRDPAEVWAYRRIAAPIYDHYLRETGSQIKAAGMLSKWARAAIGPENGAWITGGRGLLMHGWGQCGAMTWLLQCLANSVDLPGRGVFVIGDVNCEILLREKDWDRPHWVNFIPFSNEYLDPGLQAPDSTRNGWSALDLALDYHRRKKNLNYQSRTILGDQCYGRVRIETVDAALGRWGRVYVIDSLTTYSSPPAEKLYPDKSW